MGKSSLVLGTFLTTSTPHPACFEKAFDEKRGEASVCLWCVCDVFVVCL